MDDLTSFSDDQLSTLILNAQREQQARHERRKAELLENFRAQAAALGLDPSKLAAAFSKRNGRVHSSTGGDRRSKVEPKWRNPADPTQTQTWAGRGRRPPWIELGPDGQPLPKFAIAGGGHRAP